MQPDAGIGDDGVFWIDAAVDWIEDRLEYEVASLYQVFRGLDGYRDLTLGCTRTALTVELDRLTRHGKASGALAFASSWPGKTHLVRGRGA